MPIPLQTFDARGPVRAVREEALLPDAVAGVSIAAVSLPAAAVHVEEPSDADVVWLAVGGGGRLEAEAASVSITAETIVRPPFGIRHRFTAGAEPLRLVRVRKQLADVDRSAIAAPGADRIYVRQFRDCPAYGEAIKSRETVSRTVLPEGLVPRTAMGTVEAAGPDRVARHRHPMLEQLFLGLAGNDVTVSADEDRVAFREFSLLHIPRGSYHGVEVGVGRRLRYVWMDFFETTEAQEWLKTHKPLEERPPAS